MYVPYYVLLDVYVEKQLSRGVLKNQFTPQNMKFSIKDFSVNVTKSAGNCGFGHIY